MILVIETLVYPQAWVDHLLWGSILVFLLSRGPGADTEQSALRQARLVPKKLDPVGGGSEFD